MTNYFNSLLCAIKNQIFNHNEKLDFQNDEIFIKELFLISKKFEISPIIDHIFLSGFELDERVGQKLNKDLFSYIIQTERIAYELENISNCFNGAKIDFIKLKGSVIRKFYPKPYFRTSCDIDILIRQKDVKKATQALLDAGFTFREHDIYVEQFVSPSGVSIELHYSLNGNYNKKVFSQLSQAFENATPCEKDKFEYSFNNEFFMFYFIAHMEKHFAGGCGVRPFIDLKLLNENLQYDKDKLLSMLESCSLKEFYLYCVKLCGVWFEDKPHDEVTLLMEEHIANGGVYGNLENAYATKQAKSGGKNKYLFRRIFLPYEQLAGIYPRLIGRKILTPFYQVKRWFRVFKKNKIKKIANEVSSNNKLDQEKLLKTQKMLEKLNLLNK